MQLWRTNVKVFYLFPCWQNCVTVTWVEHKNKKQAGKLQIHNNILPELTDFLCSEDEGLQFSFHVTRSASCVSAGTRCLGTSWTWAVVFLSPPFFLSSSCLILFFYPSSSSSSSLPGLVLVPAMQHRPVTASSDVTPSDTSLSSFSPFYLFTLCFPLSIWHLITFLNALPALPLRVSLSSLTPHPSLRSPPPHPTLLQRQRGADINTFVIIISSSPNYTAAKCSGFFLRRSAFCKH